MDHIKTAVGMFNGGEVLFQYFSLHDQGTEEEKARRRSAIIPLVMVYIFGIEVGLKAIIQGLNHKTERTHNLLTLYEKLPTQIRERINCKAAAAGGNNLDVKGLLKTHKNSFQEWRYMGDHSKVLSVYPSALRAILQAIINTHEEYFAATNKENIRTANPPRGRAPQSVVEAASRYTRDVLRNPNDKAAGPPD